MKNAVFLLTALCLLAAPSCAQDEAESADQLNKERRLIANIALRFSLYSSDNANLKITNWIQVVNLAEASDRRRFVALEESFREFGPDSGFDHSIVEKYVLLPAGIDMLDAIGGELVLISARAFPGHNGEPTRAFVAKITNSYRGQLISERQVKRIMTAAGQTIPVPESAPELPRQWREEWRAQLRSEEVLFQEQKRFVQEYVRQQRASNVVPGAMESASVSSTNSKDEPIASTEPSGPIVSPPSIWPMIGLGLLLSGVFYVWWRRRSG